MRLLKLSDDGSVKLTSFSGTDTPAYAILSHTWAHESDEEVTYNDVSRGLGTAKEGMEKLRFCSNQARNDGLQYFWIDTCCIDKFNVNELTESINSMYRWYQQAERCYVYLTDVDVDTPKAHSSHTAWNTQFRNSRWFSRGWTVQELLAPRRIEFFSRKGIRLGDKASLLPTIYTATGIDPEALRSGNLDSFSFGERLSWIRDRQTTLPEDKAYSMLGICNVYMPLIYGEGEESAFHRLEKGIARLGMWPQHDGTCAVSVMPFERNPHFVGREEEILRLQSLLSKRSHTSQIAVVGLGGIGKTQIAVEFAYRMMDERKDFSVFWTDATDSESLLQSYRAIAEKLDIPGRDEKSADVIRLVHANLNQESTNPWLLVLDNIDDMHMWAFHQTKGTEDRLVHHLPSNPKGSILFTTRNRKVAVKLSQQNVIKIGELQPQVSLRLLRMRLAEPQLTSDFAIEETLLEALANLPLAIVQASAYINTNGITIAAYLKLFKEQDETTMALLSEGFDDEGRYPGTHNTIATTWLISFEHIRRDNPTAADYLSFMACIEPKDIPLTLLPCGASRKQHLDAIGILHAYSFVAWRNMNQSLDVHPLVHLATRNWLSKHDLLRTWTEKTIAHLADQFPSINHNKRDIWRPYLSSAMYTLRQRLVIDNNDYRAKLARNVGLCLLNDGRYNEAEDSFNEVLDEQQRTLGDEHPVTLTVKADLASTYRSQRRWVEAEQLEIQVVETSKRVLGDEHPDTLSIMTNLASTYRSQGRWVEAEQLEVQVVETSKRVLGDEHPDTLSIMTNLASTYRSQGRWAEAEQLEVQVVETSKRVLGDEHPDTLAFTTNLASTYWDQGRWNEAEQLEVQVMRIRERTLGKKHPDTLTIKANLASTYRSQGRWTEAGRLEVQVIEIRKRTLGETHPDTLSCVSNFATTLWNQGRWIEAENIAVCVLAAQQRTLGDQHPSTLTSMANLATIFWKQARYSSAVELQIEVLAKTKSLYGNDHPYMITALNNLASFYRDQGKFEESTAIRIHVVDRRIRSLGNNHPHTISAMNNLASSYKDQGELSKAIEMQRDVLERRQRIIGHEHPDTSSAKNNLASMLKDQGNFGEAEAMYKQSLLEKVKVLGPKHASTLNTYNNLGRLYASQGKLDAAETLYTRALQGYEEALGPKHASTLSVVNNLGRLYADQGKLKLAEKMYVRALEGYDDVINIDHVDTYRAANKTLQNFGDLLLKYRPEKAKAMYERTLSRYTCVVASSGDYIDLKQRLAALKWRPLLPPDTNGMFIRHPGLR
ncbi:kinesin light chain 3 [Pseudovirgaria hyperparasitica]|uniref:Kinesin light chain 3 n=1 Tax=Pseudovirgaria hyperparasitica TaxID=470096 RepID=A0A6A6VUV2_9PEZI|nr:kinesin light chain 3 [Pseudovirgaria hyperparasitica]KAF2753659.1 kinesin light chain 3 [Pseudovirgaria hyperparasitica]